MGFYTSFFLKMTVETTDRIEFAIALAACRKRERKRKGSRLSQFQDPLLRLRPEQVSAVARTVHAIHCNALLQIEHVDEEHMLLGISITLHRLHTNELSPVEMEGLAVVLSRSVMTHHCLTPIGLCSTVPQQGTAPVMEHCIALLVDAVCYSCTDSMWHLKTWV